MATAKIQMPDAPDSLADLVMLVCEKLQLSPTQYELAKSHYEALGEWLDATGSPLTPYHPRIFPQGSIKIGTTLKPWAYEEYDIDLVCELQVDWQRTSNPILVLDLVERRIRSNGRYATSTERKNRCIRVTYNHDFHMDVLPACPDRTKGGTCLVVPDREAHSWKPSNPEGYAKWFEQKSELLGSIFFKAESLPPHERAKRKSILKRVVQLIKRYRDVYLRNSSEFRTPSVVITTLAAMHYSGEASVIEAMENILEKILNSIPVQGRLIVRNPTNTEEDFSEKWNEPRRYALFLDMVRTMLAAWRNLRLARGMPNVVNILKRMFGEQVAISAGDMYAAKFNEARTAGTLGMVGGGAGLISVASRGDAIKIPNHTYHGS